MPVSELEMSFKSFVHILSAKLLSICVSVSGNQIKFTHSHDNQTILRLDYSITYFDKCYISSNNSNNHPST